MALVSNEAVRRGLRELSDERFVAFVEALWTARGAETRPVETGVVEARRGGRSETLRPVTGRRVPPGADEDTVLVLSRPSSAVRGTDGHDDRVVDADDLRAMLLYAVPRSTADDLCRRFFRRPLVTEESPPAASLTARMPEYSAPLVVGLLGVVLVVAGVAGTPALFGTGVSTADTSAPVESGDTPTVEQPASDRDASPTPSRAERSVAGGNRYPPGLGPGGVVDEDALAKAHAKQVTGRSYRLTITHREFADRQPTAYRRETVTVASLSRYRTDLEGAGELRHDSLVVSDIEAFADGRRRYARRAVADEFEQSYTVTVGPLREVRNGDDRYADRVERYVEWYLSVSESGIAGTFERDGTRYYWVRLGPDPYPGVENSTGSAVVDENGVVHEVWRRYDVPNEPGVSVVVAVRYTQFGNVSVTPPAWYDDAVEEREADDAGEGDTDEDGTSEPTSALGATPTSTATSTSTATRSGTETASATASTPAANRSVSE